MKIEPNISPVATSRAAEGRPRSDAAKGSPEADVKVSPLGAQLAAAEQALQDAPEVNAERVAELKQAIAEGRFRINPDAIAGRLLDTAREALTAHG